MIHSQVMHDSQLGNARFTAGNARFTAGNARKLKHRIPSKHR